VRFVNDVVDAEVIEKLAENEIIALRCAGFNNVDLIAAQKQV
jgi:D-lactate dehydrogenase